jgi:hypothetical protein
MSDTPTPARTYSTYFIQAVDGGNIKIGKAFDSEKRLKDHQCGSSKLLRLLGVLPEDRETEFHSRFSALREHGEWFRPEKPLMDYLRDVFDGIPPEPITSPSIGSLLDKAPPPNSPLAIVMQHLLDTNPGQFFPSIEEPDDNTSWAMHLDDIHEIIFDQPPKSCDDEDSEEEAGGDDCECESCMLFDAADHLSRIPYRGLIVQKEHASIVLIVDWTDRPPHLQHAIADALTMVSFYFDAVYLNIHAILLRGDGRYDIVEMTPLGAQGWLNLPKREWMCATASLTGSAEPYDVATDSTIRGTP